MGKADRGRAKLADARSFGAGVYGDELHAKRIASLAGATLGVMRAVAATPPLPAARSRHRPSAPA